jgi:hypothetical protein
VDPRKRWVAIAERQGETWCLQAPNLVGAVDTFLARLSAMAAGEPVALGVDLPLGVPRAYAATRQEPDFPTFLMEVGRQPGFFAVCSELAEVASHRPFYPMRGIAGMTRAAHALALGLTGAGDLSRICDRATAERPAGAPVFWTLGANQSGKAAAAAWRDLLVPAIGGQPAIRLWPFAGRFRRLLAPGSVAVAETYPAEALRHLGLRLRGSKRRQADRASLADPLFGVMDGLAVRPTPAMAQTVADGFGADAPGEDRFDCTLGVLCVINVLAGNRPDGVPDDPWIRRWEGWVLGQTSLPAGYAPSEAPEPAGATRA